MNKLKAILKKRVKVVVNHTSKEKQTGLSSVSVKTKHPIDIQTILESIKKPLVINKG